MAEPREMNEQKLLVNAVTNRVSNTDITKNASAEIIKSSKPQSRRPRNRNKANTNSNLSTPPKAAEHIAPKVLPQENKDVGNRTETNSLVADIPASENVEEKTKGKTGKRSTRKRFQHKVTQRRSEIDALKASKKLKVFQIEPELFQLLLTPSDPDFPFPIPFLSFDLHVSRHYPNQGPSPWLEIKNEDIPKGNAVNIENGFRKYEGTLINRVNLLDLNLEFLLTLPPAKVITFVKAARKEITHTGNKTGITVRSNLKNETTESQSSTPKSTEFRNDSRKASTQSKLVAENPQSDFRNKPDSEPVPPARDMSESDEPDIFGYSDSSSSSSDDETYAHSSDDEDIDAGAGSASSFATSGPKREGTELMFPDIELVNIALCEVLSLNVVFQCGRCKAAHTFTNLQSAEYGKPTKPRAELCGKCDLPLLAAFRKQFIHSMCQTAGYLDVEGGKVLDLLPSTYSAMCGSCQTIAPPFKNMDLGAQRMVICRNCHTKMLMKIELFDFVLLSTESLASDAKKTEKAKLGPSAPKQRLNLIGGEPLPSFGACQHYRKSTRWFRFSCCQRVFACDVCHDAEMQHPCELASRMLCGYCSREQRFSPKCHYCDHDYTHKTSRFWEGGKGVRDRKLMSRKDKRKYKRDGSEKTKKEVHFQGKSKPVSHS